MEFYSIVDQKDEKILEILKENAKLSTKQISKRVNLPITTVHNRIKKLEKEGIVKGYSVILDNKKLGKNLSAYVLISADLKLLKEKNRTQHDLAKDLRKLPCTEKVDIVTGKSDLVVYINVKDIEELDKFLLGKIHNIEGVNNTQTLIIIHEY